jgi:D-alanyl-D-alanine carboxypeptidase
VSREIVARAVPRAFAKMMVFSALTVLSAIALRIPANLEAVRAPVVRFFTRAAPQGPSVFEQESAMAPAMLLDRWGPMIEEASRRFSIPVSWIRAVMRRESGGRTMLDNTTPMTSDVGAEGLMQVMPETYDEMRVQYGLGNDAYNPHDNIIAGAAYMRWLYKRYGFPKMFAAYNDGPGNFDKHTAGKRDLPPETVAYLAAISAEVGEPAAKSRRRTRMAAAAHTRLAFGA